MTAIIRNSFYSSITLGLRFLSTAVLFIILARVLGVEEFGRFAFAVSFTGIFLTIVDYGFNLLVVREVAISPKDALNISNDILSGKIILSLVSAFVIVVTIKLLKYPYETERIIYILWLAVIFYSFGLFLNAIFRGLNQFQYETYPTIFLNGIQFVLVLVLLLLDFKTLSVAVVYLISRIIYFFVSLYLVDKKIGRLSLSLNFPRILKLLTESLPFGIHAIIGMLYFQLDTVFLSHFKGNVEVGYYQAAMRIVVASMIIYEIFMSSYFPLIAMQFKTDMTAFRKYGQALNKYMLLTGSVIAVFLLLYSDILIKLLYGVEYANSIYIMQLLAIVIFLRFLGASYAVFITAADNQMLRAIGVSVSLIINIVLNIILIPQYGAVGAAVVSIITHVVLDAIYIFFAVRLTGDKFLDRYCFRGLIILCLSFVVSLSLKTAMPILSIGVFILFMILLVLFALNSEEKQVVRYIFNKIALREV